MFIYTFASAFEPPINFECRHRCCSRRLACRCQKSSSDTPNRLRLRSELFTDHRPPSISSMSRTGWRCHIWIRLKSVGACIALLVSCTLRVREHRVSLSENIMIRGIILDTHSIESVGWWMAVHYAHNLYILILFRWWRNAYTFNHKWL